MSKLKWGLGGVVAVVGAVAGANFYADQSLKNYYQGQVNSKNLVQMKYEHFNMGIFSGSADWTFSMILDPCQPNTMINVKGQDKIQRSLLGYRIESQVNLDAKQQNDLQKIYQKPILMVTDITWLGKMDTTITLPEMNFQQNGLKIIGTPSELKIQSKKVQNQFKIVDFSSYLEKIELQQGALKFLAQKISINSSHSALNTTVLEDGYSKMDVGEIQFSIGGKDTTNINLKDLSWNAETKLQKRTVDFMSQVSLNHLYVGKRHFSDIAFNFDMTDVNKEKIQNMFDHYDRLVRECKPNININQELEKDLLAVISQGFKFKSADNQIKAGQASAKFSMDGKFLPENHATAKGFIEAAPSLLQYTMTANVDKNILKTFRPDATPREIDMMTDQLVEKMQLQRKGDSLHMSMQYKHGEKKFMKEIPKN